MIENITKVLLCMYLNYAPFISEQKKNYLKVTTATTSECFDMHYSSFVQRLLSMFINPDCSSYFNPLFSISTLCSLTLTRSISVIMKSIVFTLLTTSAGFTFDPNIVLITSFSILFRSSSFLFIDVVSNEYL